MAYSYPICRYLNPNSYRDGEIVAVLGIEENCYRVQRVAMHTPALVDEASFLAEPQHLRRLAAPEDLSVGSQVTYVFDDDEYLQGIFHVDHQLDTVVRVSKADWDHSETYMAYKFWPVGRPFETMPALGPQRPRQLSLF